VRRGVIRCYRVGGFVIPGMIPHVWNTFANQGHETSLSTVNYFMEKCATVWIEKW